MKEYLNKHKWHFAIFFCLIFIVAVSGYFSFRTPNTKIQTPKIQNTISDTVSTTQSTHNKIQIENTEEIDTTKYEKEEVQIISTDVDVIPEEKQPPTEKQNIEPRNPITLTIDGEKYYTEVLEGSTVYEMMQTLTAMSVKSFSFTTKEFAGMGHFVESINGVKNDIKAGKYWIYYINGQSAQVGISNQKLNSNDIIEWKYESSNF
jgi:hypothetical protein